MSALKLSESIRKLRKSLMPTLHAGMQMSPKSAREFVFAIAMLERQACAQERLLMRQTPQRLNALSETIADEIAALNFTAKSLAEMTASLQAGECVNAAANDEHGDDMELALKSLAQIMAGEAVDLGMDAPVF